MNRKAAEQLILEFMKDIDPSGYNVEVYKAILKNMNDKDFHEYMKGIREGNKFLVVFKPMFEAKGITVENNLKIAKKYGVEFFEHLIYKNTPEGIDFKTPIKYLVIDLPYRRQSQNLVKKISVPDDNKVIDETVYQPTGDSKGAKLSYPELQVLLGMDLENAITELMVFRGGDRNGFKAYNAMFLRYGSANMKTLNNYASGVESTKTLKAYLTAMHISNTL